MLDKIIKCLHTLGMSGASIQTGARVYMKLAICGEPGCVRGFDRKGYALVEWIDLPEIGRWTAHDPESLIVDEAFTVKQLELFEEIAA